MNGQASDKSLEERLPTDVYPENDLVRWLRQGADAVRPHLTTIFIAVAAALVLWGYFAWRRHTDRVERSAAWNDYFAEDYESVISKHHGTEAARFARMRIAENSIIEGRSLILSKRSDALKAFEKADLQLDALVADPEAPPDLRRTAMYLKAMALEASGAPEKAKEQYMKLTMQYKDSQEARVAEARIKDLSRKSAVDFYRQLADYKPGNRPGLPPPVKSSGNIDDLLRGLEGANPNLPAPPKVNSSAPEKKDAIPSPPPVKKTPDAPPGKDLPKDDKSAPKEAPKTPPSKPAEPPKK